MHGMQVSDADKHVTGLVQYSQVYFAALQVVEAVMSAALLQMKDCFPSDQDISSDQYTIS